MADELQPPQPDTSVPTLERQAELEAAYEQQKDTDAPYEGVRIQTLGELQWIMAQRQWSGEYQLPNGMQRANLSGADLFRANFSRANLIGADLSGAGLIEVNLSGASLIGANLSGVNLRYAHLSDANLIEADLSGADLREAKLSRTQMTNSTLTDATFLFVIGKPHWPTLPEAEYARVRQEAAAIVTPAERLGYLPWHWPGILVEELIAAHPNTPAKTLGRLAERVPMAFLRNPVLPLLFLENPHWLSLRDANHILQAITEEGMELSPEDIAIVHLIKQRAKAGHPR